MSTLKIIDPATLKVWLPQQTLSGGTTPNKANAAITATVSGSPSLVDGKFGKTLALTGNEISMSNNTDIDGTGKNFWLSAIVTPSNVTTIQRLFKNTGDNAGVGKFMAIFRINTNRTVGVYVWAASVAPTLSAISTATLTANKLVFLDATYKSLTGTTGTASVYINGVLAATTTGTVAQSTNVRDSWQIGDAATDGVGYSPFTGRIEHPMIHSRCPDAKEVSLNYYAKRRAICG